jgi:hypothetical protein
MVEGGLNVEEVDIIGLFTYCEKLVFVIVIAEAVDAMDRIGAAVP